MKETGKRHSGGGDQRTKSRDATPKLEDIGITKTQSSRWQQMAALPKDAQAKLIEKAKNKAHNAFQDEERPSRTSEGRRAPRRQSRTHKGKVRRPRPCQASCGGL
jgi:hypothetical protein